MTLITQQADLQAFMSRANAYPFLTVDTEFLREKTYYPKLCLIQIGTPDGEAVAIDPLAEGIDLSPVFDMLRNQNILKIFHAARQDLEIFYQLMGDVPAPLFDTQIAAMVCGHGDQVGYENLVRTLTDASIDKTSQFTDWSRRPLSDKQLNYALGDVTHLVKIYQKLDKELTQRNRTHWLMAEEETLNDPATYVNDPDQMWKKIKIKSNKPAVLAMLKALAAWREKRAQRKDIPKNWVMKDDTLSDLAAHPPKSPEDLKKIRGFPKDKAEGKVGKEILKLTKATLASDPEDWPEKCKKKPLSPRQAATVDVLRTLLKVCAAQYDVAPKIIACGDELEAIALNKPAEDIKAMQCWRKDIFGDKATALINGEIALGFKAGKICVYHINDNTQAME